MKDGHKRTAFVVLDIETRPDPLALSIVGSRAAGGKGPSGRAALHRIVAAAALVAERSDDASWANIRLLSWDVDDGKEDRALMEIGHVLGAIESGGGKLVTYNGAAHDLPVLRRRAAALWLFGVRGLSAWSDSAADRHMDLMTGGAETERWASLRDACAPLAIALEPERTNPTCPPSPLAVRKAQSDVVATFLLLLHQLSLQHRSLEDVTHGWVALADALSADHGHLDHLLCFREHPRLSIAREHVVRCRSASRRPFEGLLDAPVA